MTESFPTVGFDPSEVAAARPSLAKVDLACSLFETHGAVRLLDVFARGFLDELRAYFLHRHRAELSGTTKPDRRPLYTVDMSGPPGRPEYYANPLLLPIVRRLLGDDVVLGAVSAVLSFPGAPQQFVHRDSPSLFDNFSIDLELPAYALTVLMPMVDANTETGSTRVWPGSHRVANLEQAKQMLSESPDVPYGSVLMTDSRVVHCGSPNRSQRVRPLLYNTYHRSWFRDWGGYQHRPSVSIGRRARLQVPEQFAHMFRIADESAGQPEGPLPLPRQLTQSAQATLRSALRHVARLARR